MQLTREVNMGKPECCSSASDLWPQSQVTTTTRPTAQATRGGSSLCLPLRVLAPPPPDRNLSVSHLTAKCQLLRFALSSLFSLSSHCEEPVPLHSKWPRMQSRKAVTSGWAPSRPPLGPFLPPPTT